MAQITFKLVMALLLAGQAMAYRVSSDAKHEEPGARAASLPARRGTERTARTERAATAPVRRGTTPTAGTEIRAGTAKSEATVARAASVPARRGTERTARTERAATAPARRGTVRSARTETRAGTVRTAAASLPLSTVDEDATDDDAAFEALLMADVRTRQSTMAGTQTAAATGTAGASASPEVFDVNLEDTASFMKSSRSSGMKTLGTQAALSIFRASEDSPAVKQSNRISTKSNIMALSNFQTTLEFQRGEGLLTPESAASIAAIEEQIQPQKDLCTPAPDGRPCKFHFCLHVGTTETEENVRADLMKQRAEAFKEALQKEGIITEGTEVSSHYGVHRFASFMMKGYTRTAEPFCAESDIVPPAKEE